MPKHKHKFKWEVIPAPTGRYRAFQYRGWPLATVAGKSAISLTCADSYEGRFSRDASPVHSIKVRVADYREGNAFVWRLLKNTFPTLKEAKEAGEDFLNEHPEFLIKKEPSNGQ
jgi:hypothetical protein